VSQAIPSNRYLSGGLAFLVHLLFFAILVFGVSWKRLPDVPVYAEMWRNLPSPEPVAAPPVRKVEAPESPPRVEKPAPEPEPEPVKADIALKAREAARKQPAELKLAETKKRQEADKRRQLADELKQQLKQQEQTRLAQEVKQLQLRQNQERQAAEQKKLAQDKARKNMDALLAEQSSQELNQESLAIKQQATNSERAKIEADYKYRIRQKILGELRLPVNLQGNPEVVYRVDLLPNGDLIRLTLVQSSRQPAYDQEVERAIRKASPLPLPPDRDMASSFRSGLELHFKPHDH
jgi:colicin import membrane protein